MSFIPFLYGVTVISVNINPLLDPRLRVAAERPAKFRALLAFNKD
jgi:hypothetical protein